MEVKYEPAKRGPNKGSLKHSVGGVSQKFKKISELYIQFAESWTGLDFSDKSLIEMYNAESYGTPVDEKKNGFYVGKQWMGVTVSMWKEDLSRGHLRLVDLYEDPRLPHWWLDRVLK